MTHCRNPFDWKLLCNIKLGIVERGDALLFLSWNQEIKHKPSKRICNKLEIRVHAVHVDTLMQWDKNFYLDVKIFEGKVTLFADTIWLDFICVFRDTSTFNFWKKFLQVLIFIKIRQFSSKFSKVCCCQIAVSF